MVCGKCGTTVSEGTKYCPNCGNKLISAENNDGQQNSGSKMGQEYCGNAQGMNNGAQCGGNNGQGMNNGPQYGGNNGYGMNNGQGYYAPPKKKDNTWLILLLVFGLLSFIPLVLAFVIIAVAVLFIFLIMILCTLGGDEVNDTVSEVMESAEISEYGEEWLEENGYSEYASYFENTQDFEGVQDDGDVQDSYGLDPKGSAGFLNGKTVLVVLYYDGADDWSGSMKDNIQNKLDIATNFLEKSGRQYGADVELVYDANGSSDLNYDIDISASIPRDIDDETEWEEILYDTEMYIDDNIDTQALIDEYDADGIAFICCLDADGTSCTYPYYEDEGSTYFNEICYMYYEYDGEEECPAVYAHEILHLFGARDLYSSNEYDGITVDFVKYIERNYPNEIMLTTYGEDGYTMYQDRVTNEITDITAYFIGWLTDIPELNDYPTIEPEYPAAFSEAAPNSGDYSDYTSYGGYDDDYGYGDDCYYGEDYYDDDCYYGEDYYDDDYYYEDYYDDYFDYWW